MKIFTTSLLLLCSLLCSATGVVASLANVITIPPNSSAACPEVHVIAARETTAPPGFGTSFQLVDLVLKAFPGATAEAVDYPAAGGANYSSSVAEGITAVLAQLEAFSARCPDSILIMHGYSQVRLPLRSSLVIAQRPDVAPQGAQIMDDAFCGGPDGESLPFTASTLISAPIGKKVAALIFMGDPRHVAGLPYNVGNATEPGVSRRGAPSTKYQILIYR